MTMLSSAIDRLRDDRVKRYIEKYNLQLTYNYL